MKQILNLLLPLLLILLNASCGNTGDVNDYSRQREDMVQYQILARGVKNPDVIRAMGKVPRHLFIPERNRDLSYGDFPVSIGEGQTISQPYIVAYMTEVLNLKSEDRILEIGTGSGYQAAILAEIVKEVYTIEIIEALGTRARKRLAEMGYKNIHVKIGDGYKGWPEKAPFDAVIVTCAPEKIPRPLVDELREGGRIIIPVGERGRVQKLVKGVKKGEVLKTEDVMLVRFVPMVHGRD